MSAVDPNKDQEFGPVVGAIIIVALFILGGLYFFLMQEERLNVPPVEESGSA